MRNVPPNIFERMQADQLSSFLVLSIFGHDGKSSFHYTNYHSNVTLTVTYFNENTQQVVTENIVYTADNGLVSADKPRMSEIIDNDTYKLRVADPDFTIRDQLYSGEYTGARILVAVGAINNTPNTIAGVAPGDYFNEYLTIYQGYLNTLEYIITPNEELLVDLEGASPFGAFDLTRVILTSRNYLRNKYPLDKSYDDVYEGSKAVQYLWGKTE